MKSSYRQDSEALKDITAFANRIGINMRSTELNEESDHLYRSCEILCCDPKFSRGYNIQFRKLSTACRGAIIAVCKDKNDQEYFSCQKHLKLARKKGLRIINMKFVNLRLDEELLNVLKDTLRLQLEYSTHKIVQSQSRKEENFWENYRSKVRDLQRLIENQIYDQETKNLPKPLKLKIGDRIKALWESTGKSMKYSKLSRFKLLKLTNIQSLYNSYGLIGYRLTANSIMGGKINGKVDNKARYTWSTIDYPLVEINGKKIKEHQK